jgi:hypothetical protein
MMVWEHCGQWSIVSKEGYCISLNVVNGKKLYAVYAPEENSNREWLGVFTTKKLAVLECENHLANDSSSKP